MLSILLLPMFFLLSTCAISEQLTWSGFSQNPGSKLKYFTIPQKGACSYAARDIILQGKLRQLRHYLILYEPDSYLIRKLSLTCDGQPASLQFTCEVKIVDGALPSKERKDQLQAKLILSEGAIMINVKDSEKNEQGRYLLFQQEHTSQTINFFTDIAIFLMILTVLLRPNQQIYHLTEDPRDLTKRIIFLTQFHVTTVLFLLQSCYHVKDAIGNWNSASWKLCVLAPIIIILYKVMEAATTRIICCRQAWAAISTVALFNIISINVFVDSYLYFISIFLVSFCEVKSKRAILHYQLCFSVIILKLILTKDFNYLGQINLHFNTLLALSIYFVLIFILSSILIYDVRRQSSIKKQLMVIVIENNDLSKSQQWIQSKLEEDCSICYQKLNKSIASLAYTPCKHVFHSQCLRKWSNQSQTCPIDRTPIRIEAIEPKQVATSKG